MMRLLQATSSDLSRKSVNDAYFPFSRRVLMIESATFAPTLRTAPSPNRIASPTAENRSPDSLTSGGSTLIPSRRHSER